MRIILKILAAPFVAVLTVLWAVLTFLFCYAVVVLEIISGIGVLLAVALFIMGQNVGGIVFLITSFLISPLGIPRIAGWLLDKMDDLNDALKDFIMT